MKKTLLTERFQQLAGIKPLYEDLEEASLEEGYNETANKLYGVNYDKLSPQEQEYVRDTIDKEPGGAFNPDEEDLTFEPEDDYVDEVELEDLDFKTLKAAFPKFYQKVKFTRTQPNGEEGPYYEDAITFPNADDSQTLIADESSLEDWKAKTLKRFGNVEIEINDEAENWFDRVTI